MDIHFIDNPFHNKYLAVMTGHITFEKLAICQIHVEIKTSLKNTKLFCIDGPEYNPSHTHEGSGDVS